MPEGHNKQQTNFSAQACIAFHTCSSQSEELLTIISSTKSVSKHVVSLFARP